MTVHLGIDFGTSTTRVALKTPEGPLPLEIGRPNALTFAGRSTMPSMIAYERAIDGLRAGHVCGTDAEDISGDDPNYKVVSNVKRLLLARHGDVPSDYSGNLPAEWDVKKGTISIWGDDVPVEEVIVNILREALKRALAALTNEFKGDPDIHFSMGLPALSGPETRNTLRQCIADAGTPPLTSRDVSEEPVLALLPYKLNERFTAGDRRLVCDIGGGTTDVAVLKFKDTTSGNLAAEVGLVNGRQFLGGSDIDRAIETEILGRIAERNPGYSVADLRKDVEETASMQHYLRQESKRIKEGLSTVNPGGSRPSDLVVDNRVSGMYGDESPIVITKQNLTDIIARSDFVRRVVRCVEDTIYMMDVMENGGFKVPGRQAGAFTVLPRRKADEIRKYTDKVFLVGGSCEMPDIREELAKALTVGSDQLVEDVLIPVQLATVQGAADKGQLDLSGVLSQPPFDVTLECPRGNEVEPLYTAFSPVFDLENSALKQDVTPYDHKFSRQGRLPHFVVFKVNGERVYEKEINFPSGLTLAHECTFSIDLFGRSLIRFSPSTPNEVLDFVTYQTDTQRAILANFLTNESNKLEARKRREAGFFDHLLDRDNL